MVERKDPQQNPEHIHAVGEWFNPFVNYEEAAIMEGDEGSYGRRFPVHIEGIGNIKGTTFWASAPGSDTLAHVITPTTIIPFNEREIHEIEKLIGARLLSIGFTHRGDLQGYTVQVRFGEEGATYASQFEYAPTLNFSVTDEEKWLDVDGNKIVLFFPEREYILNQLQARIIPSTLPSELDLRV